jgi:ADP-ribose pyrophosphatase YjhB (NUDIX family)
VLLVERAGKPLQGYWSLPGGLVESGETLEQAVSREVLEETGLRVKPVRMYGVFERIMRDAQGRAEYHFLLIDYVCRARSAALRPSDDASRAEWVLARDLCNYQLTAGTLEVIEAAFREEADAERGRAKPPALKSIQLEEVHARRKRS